MYSRKSVVTSSGSALSENPVNPRRSQKSLPVISRRWLSSCFSPPEATIKIQPPAEGRKRRRRLAHTFDFVHLVGDAPFELLVKFDDVLSSFRAIHGLQQVARFSIAITAWAAKFSTSAICLAVKGRTSWR